MGFIRAGFTGGFIGIVIGVGAIFINNQILQKLSSLGFLLAAAFGKVCIDSFYGGCSLTDKFTTVIATVIGNCIAYFIVGALLSLAISTISLWLRPSSKVESTTVQTAAPQQPPAPVQQVVQAPPPQTVIVKLSKETKRPEAKATISKKKISKK